MDRPELKQLIPQDKEVQFSIIPKKTTGIIQPLGVFDFQIWKNLVPIFSDNVSDIMKFFKKMISIYTPVMK